MNSGIYQIKNTVNGKIYVGSTTNMRRRWTDHRSKLFRGKHGNSHLQSAWNKYGSASIMFEVLELCNKELLTVREQCWIDTTRAWPDGYNIRPIAESSRGLVWTEDRKTAHKLRLSDPVTREKLAAAKRGRSPSDETRNKMSRSADGKPKSEATRVKMQIAAQNRDPIVQAAATSRMLDARWGKPGVHS